MELVTIILTTLNSERFLARSIESCLNQTYGNLELLIVDGGSTDRTLEIVAGYDDPRIRVLHQRDNAGKLPGALNLGMANARGEFITWTQDDCWYELNAIERMVEYLHLHPETALVYTDYWFVDGFGSRIRLQPAGNPKHIADGGDIIGQCFLFRRIVYETIGPQDVRYFPVHEVPWRINLSKHFKIEPLHEPLMFYTVHTHSLTGQIGAWELQYISARFLRQAGYFDLPRYRKRVAQLHIHQAYEEFVLQGHYRSFWLHLLSGLWYGPHNLKNLGMLKLALVSLLPGRNRYRLKLLTAWQADASAQVVSALTAHSMKNAHII